MSFRHNSTGISDLQDYTKLEDKKRYNFTIREAKEAETKRGDPIVYLKVEADEEPMVMIDHSVVFLQKGKPGDGLSVKFRKVIGVPYGGDDEVNSFDWINKRFSAYNTYKEYNGKLTDSLSSIEPVKEEKAKSDIPF